MWISNDGLDDRQIAIAMLRAFRGMTQDQLAEAADLSPGTVSLLESGQQTPRDETFEQIGKGADVAEPLVDDLLRWIRKARAADRRCADPQDLRRLGEGAATALTDALADLLQATGAWIEVRRATPPKEPEGSILTDPGTVSTPPSRPY